MDIFPKDELKDFSDEELSEIESIFTVKKYRKGDFIINENTFVTSVYFIKSGLVKLSHSDNDAKEFILSFAFENWWETDFEAFYSQSKSLLTLQCLEDTEVYCLNYPDYFTILERYSLSNYFLDKSIRGHIANQRRILSLLTQTPKEKYEQFLVAYPSLINRIPKSVLALYLGVSRETLSRLYKQNNR